MIVNNNKQFEIDGYLRIIDNFQARDLNNKVNEIWKYRSYIELMKTLERTNNKTNFSNKIILMLALFEDLSPDSYNIIGENINEISKYDKNLAINLLKGEFVLE